MGDAEHIERGGRFVPLLAAAALLAVAGCASAAPFRTEPRYVAYGNDPGWLLTIARGRIELAAQPRLHVVVPRTPPTSTEVGLRYRAAGLVIDVERRPCHDRTSGLTFSDTVRVAVSSAVFTGCGGRRLPLLDT